MKHHSRKVRTCCSKRQVRLLFFAPGNKQHKLVSIRPEVKDPVAETQNIASENPDIPTNKASVPHAFALKHLNPDQKYQTLV
jgi:hypothetical protein